MIKTYSDPLLGARSPCVLNNRYYYFEGGWVRRAKTSVAPDAPAAEHYYPNSGGTLIEILSNNIAVNHGSAERTETIDDSPDPSNPIYDGFGLRNACVSNLACNHQADTVNLIAGFGIPYRLADNLPTQSREHSINTIDNFDWIQYGKTLSTKLSTYKTADRQVWDMITELGRAIDYEVGFGPSPAVVASGMAADASLTEFAANATVYFRQRTILPATLRTAIAATGTPTTILLDAATLSEFPNAPNMVVIDKELFRYTGSATNGDGIALTGITRGQHGSIAVTHTVGAIVYFSDYFVSSELDNVLVTVTDKQLDYSNIKNIVKMAYGPNISEQRDRVSVANNGGKTLNLPSVLAKSNRIWADEMTERYVNEKDPQTLITYIDKLTPSLSLSQLVVMHLHQRAKTDYEIFKVVRLTHDMSRYQTQAVIRSLPHIGEGDLIAASITAISGGGQSAPINTALNNSLIIEVRDQHNNPLSDAAVSIHNHRRNT